jgi:hypothetical protein
MPELDGRAFYTLLLQYRALRQRVIFLTGESGAADTRAFLAQCSRLPGRARDGARRVTSGLGLARPGVSCVRHGGGRPSSCSGRSRAMTGR